MLTRLLNSIKAEMQATTTLPMPLLEGVEFERDYVGGELAEIKARNIQAPEYRIKMGIADR